MPAHATHSLSPKRLQTGAADDNTGNQQDEGGGGARADGGERKPGLARLGQQARHIQRQRDEPHARERHAPRAPPVHGGDGQGCQRRADAQHNHVHYGKEVEGAVRR